MDRKEDETGRVLERAVFTMWGQEEGGCTGFLLLSLSMFPGPHTSQVWKTIQSSEVKKISYLNLNIHIKGSPSPFEKKCPRQGGKYNRMVGTALRKKQGNCPTKSNLKNGCQCTRHLQSRQTQDALSYCFTSEWAGQSNPITVLVQQSEEPKVWEISNQHPEWCGTEDNSQKTICLRTSPTSIMS